MDKGKRKGLKIWLISIICALVVAGGVGAATASNWTGSGSSAQSPSALAPSQTPTATPTPAKPVTVALLPEDGASQVNPAAPVSVVATNATISDIVLTDSTTGAAVEGSLALGDASWKATGALVFNTSYTLAYSLTDSAGQTTQRTSKFSTVPASHEADAAMYPSGAFPVGVAQPIQWTFSEPVVNKEAVEKAITVTSSAGQVGAFHWYSDTLLRYRAADFWAANSTLSVDMKLFGVDFGNGQIGNFNKSAVIPIGNKVVMVADAANHVADVYINDVLAQHFLVTMGDERFPSASGYLVVLNDKQRHAHFVASTIGLQPGDPANYGELDVEYATRLTPSGEFIHQATPSALPYIGQVNLSHGCIGMDGAGASWVFNNMGVGDLVQVINSPNETIAPTDGFGDWNIPFEQYASR
ncbi:Ig-like domain-containing protein [Arthrobacter sp. 35W]|uniref:Ig-like domain-containing protein n=1 Tax=Arthrobacter sp. 35W TaxID=1132441 RepID=UPI0003FED73F|nr:Ig-like domain-containing protein [Arthrobacter sp. 35W]